MTRISGDERRALNLLIVEDDTLTCMDFEIMLEELGHKVLGVASHNARALEMIEKHREKLDGAILDVKLGSRLARPVARRLKDCNIPYLIVSGMDQRDVARLGFEARYLPKPCTSPDFARALTGWAQPDQPEAAKK